MFWIIFDTATAPVLEIGANNSAREWPYTSNTTGVSSCASETCYKTSCEVTIDHELCRLRIALSKRCTATSETRQLSMHGIPDQVPWRIRAMWESFRI